MREIKFRGKDKRTGKWVYGYFVKTVKMNKQNALIPVCYITTGEHYYEVDCDTVGQYVGHKDNNKREIYEGDIIGFENEAVGVVKWEEFLCRFYIEGEWYEDLRPDSIKENNYVVLGNIYDNPELLKEVSEE